MSDRPYSRLYHELADEYPDLFDSPDLAGYVRLLIAADQAWPSKARWAGYVEPDELDRLTSTGLIVRDGKRYSIKGLDKERKRRRVAGRTGAAARWQSDPEEDRNALRNAVRIAEGNADRIPDRNANAMPRRDETSKDETSRDKTRRTARDRSRGLEPLSKLLGGAT